MKLKSLIGTFAGAALGIAGGAAFAIMGGSSLFLLGTVAITTAAIIGGGTATGAVIDIGRAVVKNKMAAAKARKQEAESIQIAF